MKKYKFFKLFSNKYVNYSMILIFGILLGWLVSHPANKKSEKRTQQKEVKQVQVWTCSMHPQIRMNEPGKCPICGMDLIPQGKSSSMDMDQGVVQLSHEAAQLANVTTSVVTRQKPVKEVRLYGKVQADERLLQNQVSHVAGRIEKLYVNFTGESVVKGEVLAQIYSPELITAQQELIEASKTKQGQPAIYEAAKEKLHQLKLTDSQIETIETSGKIQVTLDAVSNTDGIVISRLVNKGDYVSKGTSLFMIADLSKIWVLFDAYERDLQFIKKGQKVKFSLQSFPGEEFSGNIVFIDPVLDPVTRVAKVRVEADNHSGKLKPEMFATGIISSTLKEYGEKPVIPKSAVLWTGKRSIVYVKLKDSDQPAFKMRQVELGPSLEDSYIVTDGLSEGEEVVTSGTFSVDAEAQLEGKPSMMNSAVMPGSSIQKTGKIQTINNETFDVSGDCEMCKDRIETTAKSVKGVSTANWDMNTKKLNIVYDSSVTSLDNIQKAIADAGHDNVKYRAPDDVYNKLPECCLYRK